MKYNIAVVGATGMVGRTIIKVLEERNLSINKLLLFGSKRSKGKKIKFKNQQIEVVELKEENINDIDIALFSAGGEVSKKYAPIFVSKGSLVIDNSSQWRMNKEVPLVVPEVNSLAIKNNKGIISNPNCSTIQSVLPLKPLYDKYGIKRIIYSTYQAVSGAGVKGTNDLKNNTKLNFKHQINNNIIPQIDVFLDNGYTKEEMKMIEETKKILEDKDLLVTATTVRVPVINSHSISINVELKKEYKIEDVKELLKNFKGIILKDDIEKELYPMPIDSDGKDEVFIGRIRRDYSVKNGLNLWCVADNIRKGAATNTVQIAEEYIKIKEKR